MKNFVEKMRGKINSALNKPSSMNNTNETIENRLLFGYLKDSLSSTINKSKDLLSDPSKKCGEVVNKIKVKYGEIKAHVNYIIALENAKSFEVEEISFSKANANTLFLIEKLKQHKNSDNYQKLIVAIEMLSLILAEIYHNLSDLDYATIESSLDILEKANLANFNVARRLTDKNLYVGLLGEFSCGKSTFINALLEDDFLYGDPLQATTCAKTVVSYSPNENIRAILDNGKYIDLRTEKDGAFLDAVKKKEFIRQMTANEKFASSVREVICHVPNPVLINGLSIVDTPGIGSHNTRHDEVTRAAISDCDAVLVLTTLQKPLSSELIDSVKRLVGQDAPNCIFIGTRKDQLPKKELPRQHKYFSINLNKAFGRECPFEFVSAQQALEELAGKPAIENALHEFRQFRAKVQSILESNRSVIQACKTQVIIDSLVNDISEHFGKQVEEFSKKKSEFINQVVPKDSGKWMEWQKEITYRYKSQLKTIRGSYRIQASKLVDQIRSLIESQIENIDDSSKLKNYLAGGINHTFESFRPRIENASSTFIYTPFYLASSTLLNEYSERFKKEYTKIETIFGNTSKSNLPALERQQIKVKAGTSSSGFSSLATNMEKEENIKMGGGMATGIAISMCVPGVGWLAAGGMALIGGLLGAGLMKSLKKRKKEALDKLEDSMKEFEARFIEQLDNAYESIHTQFEQAFEQELKDRNEEYVRVIDSHNDFIENMTHKLSCSSELISKKLAILQGVADSLTQIKQEQFFMTAGEDHE